MEVTFHENVTYYSAGKQEVQGGVLASLSFPMVPPSNVDHDDRINATSDVQIP